MKNLWLVLLLTIPFGCKPADTTTPTDSNSTSAAVTTPSDVIAVDDANLTKMVISVEGMKCSVACPPAVKGALESVAGVNGVDVDYDQKLAVVTVDGEFNQNDAVRALAEAGFEGSLN